MRNKISYNIILPYKDKITIDYEISYFGFNFDLILNCGSPLRDFEVKMDRFQIKQNVLSLKSTLKRSEFLKWDYVEKYRISRIHYH